MDVRRKFREWLLLIALLASAPLLCTAAPETGTTAKVPLAEELSSHLIYKILSAADPVAVLEELGDVESEERRVSDKTVSRRYSVEAGILAVSYHFLEDRASPRPKTFGHKLEISAQKRNLFENEDEVRRWVGRFVKVESGAGLPVYGGWADDALEDYLFYVGVFDLSSVHVEWFYRENVSYSKFSPGSGAALASFAELCSLARFTKSARKRIDQFPVLVPANQAVENVKLMVLDKVSFPERTLTLNRAPMIVDGHRYDGFAVVAPSTPAGFAWIFAVPGNVAGWSILSEEPKLIRFKDWIVVPRKDLPEIKHFEPTGGTHCVVQVLDAAAFTPGKRYLIWFHFSDDQPVTMTLRAGFIETRRGWLTYPRAQKMLTPAAKP